MVESSQSNRKNHTISPKGNEMVEMVLEPHPQGGERGVLKHAPLAALGTVSAPTTHPGASNVPGHVRILLSSEASKALLEAGTVFMVAGRASHPDPGDRIALHFVPCSMEAITDATEVALGRAKAVRPKAPKV